MDLPPDKVKVLKSYDDDKKWDMICDQVCFAWLCDLCCTSWSPPPFDMDHFIYLINVKNCSLYAG